MTPPVSEQRHCYLLSGTYYDCTSLYSAFFAFRKHYDYTCYMQNFDILGIKLIYVAERTGLSLTFS